MDRLSILKSGTAAFAGVNAAAAAACCAAVGAESDPRRTGSDPTREPSFFVRKPTDAAQLVAIGLPEPQVRIARRHARPRMRA